MNPGSPHCQVQEQIFGKYYFASMNSGYGTGTFAPGVSGIGTTSYISAHNQILAHARAYRLYHDVYSNVQGGRVGISLNIHWAEPQDPSNPDHLGKLSLDSFITVSGMLQRHLRESSSLP